jgi:hypothetical protein
MKIQFVDSTSIATWRKQVEPGVVACGVWLRVGFIGACASAAGIAKLFDGKVNPLAALALAVGGVVLAVFSWRRARNVLDIADDTTSTVKAAAGSPASALAG